MIYVENKNFWVFKVDADASVIFLDFSSKEIFEKNPPVDCNRSEIIDIIVLVRN